MTTMILQPGEIADRHLALAAKLTALREKHPELADRVEEHVSHLDAMDPQGAVNLKGRM